MTNQVELLGELFIAGFTRKQANFLVNFQNMGLEVFGRGKCFAACPTTRPLAADLRVRLPPVRLKSGLGGCLEGTDIAGDLAHIFGSPLASEGLLAGGSMSSACYPSPKILFTLEALISPTCQAAGIFLGAHIVVVDGLEPEVLLLQPLPLPDPRLLLLRLG